MPDSADSRHRHSIDESARFCARCGSGLVDRVPPLDTLPRKTCTACGFVHYLNPKLAAGAIAQQEGKVWLVRRGIEPSLGLWTFPGGYVDLGETVAEAAIRETREETSLDIRLDGLLDVYSYRDARVVLVVYRATVIGGAPRVNHECLEARAFGLDELPWDRLAFPSTRDALSDCARMSGVRDPAPVPESI